MINRDLYLVVIFYLFRIILPILDRYGIGVIEYPGVIQSAIILSPKDNHPVIEDILNGGLTFSCSLSTAGGKYCIQVGVPPMALG